MAHAPTTFSTELIPIYADERVDNFEVVGLTVIHF